MNWWTAMAWTTGRQAPRSAAPLAELHEQTLTHSLERPLVDGNQVDLLQDGPQTYAAMLDAIDTARDRIHIESYIIDADGPGEEFARRLIARCRDGVRVHLLFDSIGSMATPRAFFDSLESEGVLLCEYRPVRSLLALFSLRAHRRNHRKIMVVDDRVGFIGGLNISREYAAGSAPGLLVSKDADQDERGPGWRDSHVRVRGPVVEQLQVLFIGHWNHHARTPIAAARKWGPAEAAGAHRAVVASTAGGRRRNPFYLALLAAVNSAQVRVFITTAYFVPPRRLLRALLGAAERGVDVQLMLPGHTDFWAPLHAGRWHYGSLLRAGVRIHERHDTLLHAKTTVIDGVWSSVGSSNLDWRSTVHNAEANLLVLDAPFAAEVERVFYADVAQAQPVELQQWLQRGALDRLKEWMARRFEFLL
jgi:cardiolipin synthase A/B